MKAGVSPVVCQSVSLTRISLVEHLTQSVFNSTTCLEENTVPIWSSQAVAAEAAIRSQRSKLQYGLTADMRRRGAPGETVTEFTVSPGPFLPLAIGSKCCGAARQSRHSLQVRDGTVGELVVCGLSRHSPQLRERRLWRK